MSQVPMAVQRKSLIKFSVVWFWRKVRARSTFYRCVAGGSVSHDRVSENALSTDGFRGRKCSRTTVPNNIHAKFFLEAFNSKFYFTF